MNQLFPGSESESSRLSPWISWFVILTFGPAIAYALAGLCGFPMQQETLQVILLVEVFLLALAVSLLVLVQAIGPWTGRDREAEEWLRVMTPAPGSLLEELAQRPEAWDRRMDGYLRSMYREAAAVWPRPAKVLAPAPVASPIAPVQVSSPRNAPVATAPRALANRPSAPAVPPPEGQRGGRRAPPPGQPPRRN